MNPFMEPTVASPLPENQRVRYWSRMHDDPCPAHASDVVGSPTSADTGSPASADTGRSAAQLVRCTSAGARIKSGTKATAAALGLSAALFLPSFINALSAPTAAMAVAALATGAFLPGNAHAVDLNRATEQELRGVRGIGPKTAQMIIEERMRGGDFESISDLSDRVKGIGPKKALALQAAGLLVKASGPASVSGADNPQASAKAPAAGAAKAAGNNAAAGAPKAQRAKR